MTTNIIDFPTAQACLPLLEAEAKARQKLAGESTHSNQHKNVQLVPLLAQAAEATSSEESPVKNNLRASQEAGKIMGVGKTLVVKAKARQILSGIEHGKGGLKVVPVLAQPIGSPENPTMSPVKNNLRASEIADEAPNSPALILAKDAISNLIDDEVDDLFSYLWAMGYGEISSIFTD